MLIFDLFILFFLFLFSGRKAEAEKCNNNPVICKGVQRQKTSSKYSFIYWERCKTVLLEDRLSRKKKSIERSLVFEYFVTEHKFFSSYLPMNLIFLVDECRALLWQLTSVGLHIVVLCLQCVWKHLHTCSLHMPVKLCVYACVCEAKVVAWVKRFFLLGWLFCLNLLIFIE